MKSEIDIIIETAKHYNSNNTARKTQPDTCTYMNDKGNMCAVGRCLTDKGMQIFKVFEDKYKSTDTSIESFVGVHGLGEFDNALEEEYRGHDVEFWKHLQYLHDVSSNWDENGITKYGLEMVDSYFGHNAHSMVKEALAR